MEYHILNGDALRMQFPEQIEGEIIIARECLVDGDVQGETLEELIKTREQFIGEAYGYNEPDGYQKKTVSQFEKILQIPEGSTINFWFEEDLFCQVNFWFMSHLVKSQNKSLQTFLVLPRGSNLQYGFGGLSKPELTVSLDQKTEITPQYLDAFASLWTAYQKNDYDLMHKIENEIKANFPFVSPAIEAHLQRFPKDGEKGRPEKSIINIMEELKTQEFGPVFREFNKREAIYGFGDLQVKRIFDKLISEKN